MEKVISHDSKESKESEERERTILDWLVLGVVVAIALVVIALSFSNTTKLASELGLDPYLTAGLVEILFASLLFIRGRQRATQRNVPFFLNAGYFLSFLFVTGVNVWGLSQESPFIGAIVGVSVSGAMWLMESVLVWLWVDSHRPHKKKMKELKREVKKQIEEIKLRQQIDWMLWEAKKPDMALIEKARKVEEKRKSITKKGIPEFFRPDQDQSEKDQSNNQLKNTYPINQADYFQPIIQAFVKSFIQANTNQSTDQSNNQVSTYSQSMIVQPIVQALIQSFIQSINNQSDKRESIMIDHSIHSRSNNQPDQSEKDQSINHELINQSFQSIDHRSINQDQSIIIDQSGDDQSNVIDQSVFDHTTIDQSGDSQSIDHESINQDQSIDQSEDDQSQNDQSEINQTIKNDRSDMEESIIKQESIKQEEERKTIDQSTKSNVLNFDEELASRYPIKEALEYYKKHGKIPTHRGLKEIANTTLHRASMAVKWLKEQIEQGKVA